MKPLTLSHEHTPKALESINQKLCDILQAEELDHEQLLVLVEQRAKFLETFVTTFKDDNKRSFIESEIHVNDSLKALVEKHFKQSKVELSALVQGRNNVKKYR